MDGRGEEMVGTGIGLVEERTFQAGDRAADVQAAIVFFARRWWPRGPWDAESGEEAGSAGLV